MAELKTKPNKASVEKFINSIKDESRRDDCYEIMKMMQQATKAEPKMWGTSIVGYGSYRYKYASGREGDWFLVGFSPRKQNLTLYLMNGVSKQKDLLTKLGKHKTGKGCLYINSLGQVDKKALKELVKSAVNDLRANHKK